MKKNISTIIMILIAVIVNGQTLYKKTFGDNKNKTLIFLHGGPGFNAANFESIAARKLADNGFFVIVYDRRREGRSPDNNAIYTFKETIDDLNNIYTEYGIKKATLIDHSFGGQVAVRFAQAHPEKIQSVMLVDAPIKFQDGFKAMLSNLKKVYQAKNDSVNLKAIASIEKINTTTMQYAGSCFTHAMKGGLYATKNPTKEAKAVYATYRADTALRKYASQMRDWPAQKFYETENYINIDLRPDLNELLTRKVKVYGLYGKDDGLFLATTVAALQEQLGEKNVKYLDNCAHNVFNDQQSTFIDAIKE